MTDIIAIDPGDKVSALIVGYPNPDMGLSGIYENEELLHRLTKNFCLSRYPSRMVIEMIASYGMPVGKEIFDTCVWIGRFVQLWHQLCGTYSFVYRKDVKLCLCGDSKAKDSNIRQALLDRYPRTGGGATPQVGTKGQPGPLYGMKKDLWSALAVATTYHETVKHEQDDRCTSR